MSVIPVSRSPEPSRRGSRGIAPRARGACSELCTTEQPGEARGSRLRAVDGARSLHFGRDDRMSVGITKSDVDPTNHYFNGRARDFQRYRFHCYAPLVLFKSLRGAHLAASFFNAHLADSFPF